MGAGKFKIYAKQSYGVQVDDSRSYEIRGIFLDKYEGIREWHQRCNQDLKDNAIMPSFTLSNRYRLFRHPHQSSGMRFTGYINSQDQGSGGDIGKLSLILFDRWATYNKIDAQIISQVHDENLVDCHMEVVELVKQKLSEAMVVAAKVWITSVPVKAEAESGKTWATAKP
jgi:DNA polymerase I-like protein with 3'-5' exonuclease and polymerase domains